MKITAIIHRRSVNEICEAQIESIANTVHRLAPERENDYQSMLRCTKIREI
jgi:hypothetical protein